MPGGAPRKTRRRTAAQRTPPTPVDRAHRRELHWATQLLPRAPANAGQTSQPYNPCYTAETLTPWPHRAHSSHISRTGATLPTPPKSISVKEREGDPDTYLSFRLTFLSHKPDTRWTKLCSPTHETHRPAGFRRRTRDYYAALSPPRHAGFPDVRAHNTRECYFQGQGIKGQMCHQSRHT